MVQRITVCNFTSPRAKAALRIGSVAGAPARRWLGRDVVTAPSNVAVMPIVQQMRTRVCGLAASITVTYLIVRNAKHGMRKWNQSSVGPWFEFDAGTLEGGYSSNGGAC